MAKTESKPRSADGLPVGPERADCARDLPVTGDAAGYLLGLMENMHWFRPPPHLISERFWLLGTLKSMVHLPFANCAVWIC